MHFYRWLISRQALLYDPALQRFVHALMKKVQSRVHCVRL